MAKSATKYICTSCDSIYPAWQGKCTNCGQWNTIVRDNFDGSKLSSGVKRKETLDLKSTKILAKNISEKRLILPIASVNNILGGGIVEGQVILFAGEPGIGKSTLLTQICSNSEVKTLYISGEESIEQISKRALRIGDEKTFANTEFSDDTSLAVILTQIESSKFKLVIIDSIQTVYSSDSAGFIGSMNQVRECSAYITESAKKSNVSVIMIGQITKEGSIAGPKLLEHMVDTVLYFEGDKKNDTRILRVSKNRFGSTGEIAIYQMSEKGLEEVENLEWFFTEDLKNEEGVAYSIYNEGSAYFIIEVQALCTKSSFTYPKRVSNGYDTKRLEMLIAILTKKLRLKLEYFDIYVNIAGGIKIDDTSVDLAVASAIVSSYQNKPLPPKTCYLGEISLTGEVRKVPKQEEKLKKAKKYGFTNSYCNDNLLNISQLFNRKNN